MSDYLKEIREIFQHPSCYLAASERAVDYNTHFDICQLDSGNDYSEQFTEDEEMKLRTIATMAWQFICTGLNEEGVKHPDAVIAILHDIQIAHYG